MDVTLMLHSIPDQFGDGQHFHVVNAAEFDQVGHASHVAIVFHYFADDSCRDQARKASQVYRGFGLAGPNQHSSLTSTQWKDMAWTCEIGWAGRRINCHLN